MNCSVMVVNMILALQPGAIEIMKTGVFDPAQLSTLRPVQHRQSDSERPWPQQPGIYIICYEDFDDEVEMKVGVLDVDLALYTGQTVAFQDRDTYHNNDIRSGNCTHYKTARHAKKRAMIPIILFDPQSLTEMGIKISHALDAAELTVVCLFRSWNKALFIESSTQAFSSFAVDFTAARVFSALATRVFRKTGWAPRRVLGLNWKTPVISHSPIDRTWVGWFDPTKQMLLYRSRRRILISRDPSGKIFHASFNLSTDTGHHYELDMNMDVAEEAGLNRGDVVHIVIEIKFDGVEYRDHPFMYVPFPRVGGNPEFELLRSMAIRLEWEKDGTWNATYMERMHLWQWQGMAKVAGTLPAIKMGLQLWQAITTTRYQDQPDWLEPFHGRVCVQFLEYDHLAQEARLVNQKEKVKTWPADNSMASNTERLRRLFPPSQYPNTSIGPRPVVPDYFRTVHPNSSRLKCDLCYSQSSVSMILQLILSPQWTC